MIASGYNIRDIHDTNVESKKIYDKIPFSCYVDDYMDFIFIPFNDMIKEEFEKDGKRCCRLIIKSNIKYKFIKDDGSEFILQELKDIKYSNDEYHEILVPTFCSSGYANQSFTVYYN